MKFERFDDRAKSSNWAECSGKPHLSQALAFQQFHRYRARDRRQFRQLGAIAIAAALAALAVARWL